MKEKIKLGQYKTYGLDEEDFVLFEKCLNGSKENVKRNDFPDFLFENGFIEHFQITSSNQNKNGAPQIRSTNEAAKMAISRAERIDKGEEDPIEFFVTPITTAEHSHDFIKNSLQFNTENHIDSLKKYQDDYEVGIFMVCYADRMLAMGEVENESIVSVLNDYYLSKDRESLRYLDNYKDKIKYLIYVNEKDVEVINLAKINEIVESTNEHRIEQLFAARQNIVSVKNKDLL